MNHTNNNKNIQVDKLVVKHAQKQEYIDNESKPKTILGMKIIVNLDTYILTPVEVVTKEPKTRVLLWSPVAKYVTELQKKIMILNLLDLLDSKEKGA